MTPMSEIKSQPQVKQPWNMMYYYSRNQVWHLANLRINAAEDRNERADYCFILSLFLLLGLCVYFKLVWLI